MSRLLPLAAALALGLPAAPAGATALPGGFTLSGEAGLVSDYRFRGISLSDAKPAVQGGVTLGHDSGFYANVWSSTIAQTEGGADVELDLMAGYATEWESGLGLDLAVARYLYPSDRAIGFTELSAALSYAIGPATPRVGASYAPAQGAMRDDFGIARDNLYFFAGLEYALRGAPLTLDAQLGYERGYFDACDTGGKLDWRVGGAVALGGFSLGLSYADTDVRLPAESGRDLAGATLLASITFGF